ncbi:hypothetical protein GF318_02430 [Candidatus Micrarchaeota archaeon]|nr:hypothetical protein [Candidatus Micrarchaeota archaeon]
MKAKILVILFAALMTAVMAQNGYDPYLENRDEVANCLRDEVAGDIFSEDLEDDFDAPGEEVGILMDEMEDALSEMDTALEEADYGAFNTAYAEFMSAFNQMRGMWFYYGILFHLEEEIPLSGLFEHYKWIQDGPIYSCMMGEPTE